MTLLSHLAHTPHNARPRHARERVGRGPCRVRAYIYTQKPTDQENEVLTTKITYNTYTPCVTQMRVSYRS